MCVYKRRMCLPEGARVAVALVAAFELALKRLLAPVRHHVAVPATHADSSRSVTSSSYRETDESLKRNWPTGDLRRSVMTRIAGANLMASFFV